MTPKIRWPNFANSARTESIAQAHRIIAQLAPIKDALEANKQVGSLELSIRIGRISDATHVIINQLTTVGPDHFQEERPANEKEL